MSDYVALRVDTYDDGSLYLYREWSNGDQRRREDLSTLLVLSDEEARFLQAVSVKRWDNG